MRTCNHAFVVPKRVTTFGLVVALLVLGTITLNTITGPVYASASSPDMQAPSFSILDTAASPYATPTPPTPKPRTCSAGQHLVGNQCVQNTPTSCPSGQHLVGNQCVQNTPVNPPNSNSYPHPNPSTANAYNWYRSTGRYAYGRNFPYRYVFYVAPYYYYVQDPNGNLDSQVQTLQSQVQASQSDMDQAVAQAQQLSAQVESLNQQVSDLNSQVNNANSQYSSQVSDLQSQASNLQNSNQALQANLDAMRTQNIIMLAIVALLGVAVVIAVLMKRRAP